MTSFDTIRSRVVGRTAAQLEDLGNTLLVSLEGRSDIAPPVAPSHPSTELRILDTREEITPPPLFQGSSKTWRSVWPRVTERIADEHYFAGEANPLHVGQFAQVVRSIRRGQDDGLHAFRTAAETVEGDFGYLWKLLLCVAPEPQRVRPVMDPVQGVKRFFEERFLDHVHRRARELGMPTGRTGDAIRSYVHDRLGRTEEYPTWMLIYFSIRCGDYKTATEIASNAVFPEGCRCETPEHYLRNVMMKPDFAAVLQFPDLGQACEQLMKSGARRKLSSEYRYMLMSTAFLCGHIHIADALISESAQSWESLDEFVWFALGCVRSGNTMGMPSFDYNKLRSRLSAFEERYYTGNGRSPIRYAVVLAAGLQFGSALHYLLTQDPGRNCTMHVVHMALALLGSDLLDINEVADPKRLEKTEVAELVHQYGCRLAIDDSRRAWDYYLLAEYLRKGDMPGVPRMAEALVDVLVRSNDFSVAAIDGPVWQDVRDDETRQELLIKAAAGCEKREAFDAAVELYVKAEAYGAAVDASNRYVSRLLVEADEESGSAQRDARQSKLKYVNRLFIHIEERLQLPNEQTSVLKSIKEVLAADFKGDALEVVRRVCSLDILPKKVEEIDVELRLLKRLPTVMPLIAPLLKALCRGMEGIKSRRLEMGLRQQIQLTVTACQAIVLKLPPPFIAGQEMWRELQSAGSALFGSTQNDG